MSPRSLAIISTHPIQYLAPLYRQLVRLDIPLKVYFASDSSVRGAVDSEFLVDFAWDIPILEGYAYKFFDHKPNNSNKVGFWSFNREEIYPELRRNDFGAVLIQGYTPFYYIQALLAAKKNRIAIMLRGETTDFGRNRSTTKGFVRKILLKMLYRQITVFLPIGQHSLNHYINHGVPKEKLIFSPYSVDNNFFRSEGARWMPYRNETRAELGISKNDIVIVFSGKLSFVKDVFTLAQAIEKLDRNITMLWIGDGPLRSELENYCSNQKKARHIFIGFQNQTQISKYYSASDILVLPSLGETWGLVVNEFMNFGKPVIVSDRVGCAPDLVIPGETGFTFPVGDVHALAEAIDVFTLDAGLIEEMGCKAFQQVSKYSIENAALGIRDAFFRVAQP